ncbi:hypothetical protein NK6_7106 [Bradyrhizobium diazoefficiens]|uniref:Uncharacterized protein n=1 Tax=Bradyrhizobium diazoefficiens TaxID=1355477 RepID=A0A0E4BUH2_9BRAD|nr:hypothetical protein NK6_7106 [Bradyrhizobium diazoefficiens]
MFTILAEDVVKSSKKLRDDTVSGAGPRRLSTRLRSL